MQHLNSYSTTHSTFVTCFKQARTETTTRPVKQLTSSKKIVLQAIDELWRNQRLVESFENNTKLWPLELAKKLDMPPKTLLSAIQEFGTDNFKQLVNNNPAGTTPVITPTRRSGTSLEMQMHHSETCYCQSSQCESRVCETIWCQTKHCPSYS
jgi:hypothetical protein